MDLKLRKRIQNGALPGFANGTIKFQLPLLDDALSIFNHPSTTSGVISPADAFKQDVIDANNKAIAALPSFKRPTVAGGNWKDKFNGAAEVVSNGIGFVNTMNDISTNKYTSDEMMGSGGTTNQAANGVDYQELSVDSNGIQSLIDATAKAGTMSGVSSGAALGGSIGHVIPGVGTAIGTVGGAILGGIFGGLGSAKAKREAERLKMIAINRTNALNTQNREMAYTTGLRNRFARENVTDDTQSLFHAEKGVEGAVNPLTGQTYRHYAVNTAYGKANGPQNAWVSKGEVIRSADGSLYRVKDGPNDTARAYLKDGDSVYSKKIINPETGNPVADDAPVYAAMGMLDELDMNLNVGRMLTYTGKRKLRVLPGYIGGTRNRNPYGPVPFAPELEEDYDPTQQAVEDATTATPPAGQKSPKTASTAPRFNIGKGLGKAWNWLKGVGNGTDWGNLSALANAYMIAARRDARAQGLRAPKSFTPTSGLNAALLGLGRLRSNYYPVWAQNREIEGRGTSAIAQSGLNAGQRMLGYMGLANQTQQNNANALFNSQNTNNALASQYYKSLISANQEEARRGQQAYQWDEDMRAKAHAARENIYGTSDYDRQNAWLSYLNNRFKKNQFDQTIALYRSQADIDAAKTRAIINNLVKGV